MKRIFKITAILMVVAVIFGCHEEPEPVEPHAPTLIAPEDGAELNSGSIIMMWSSSPSVDHYEVNMIVTAGALLDTLTHIGFDTTLTVEVDTTPGTVNWKVATITDEGDSLWSETWSFTVNKSTEPTLDLDTTYFPFGLGYEWCYERHVWGYDYRIEPEEWSEYDTFTNLVTDSFWKEDTLCFQINGSIVKIWDDQIYCDVLSRRIDLKPKTDTSYTDGGADCRLWITGDTLLGVSLTIQYYETTCYSWSKQRLIGIGPISRNYSNVDGSNYSDNACDRLLYFYNGEDTVYESQLR